MKKVTCSVQWTTIGKLEVIIPDDVSSVTEYLKEHLQMATLPQTTIVSPSPLFENGIPVLVGPLTIRPGSLSLLPSQTITVKNLPQKSSYDIGDIVSFHEHWNREEKRGTIKSAHFFGTEKDPLPSFDIESLEDHTLWENIPVWCIFAYHGNMHRQYQEESVS